MSIKLKNELLNGVLEEKFRPLLLSILFFLSLCFFPIILFPAFLYEFVYLFGILVIFTILTFDISKLKYLGSEIVLYLLFLASLTITSCFLVGDFSVKNVAGTHVKFVWFLLLFLYLKNQRCKNISFFQMFSNVIFAVNFGSIISFLMVGFGHPPFMSSSIFGKDISIYLASYVSVIGSNIYGSFQPLQGMSEEPGTWAFVTIPAILFFIYRRNNFRLFICVTGYCLTGSFGAATCMLFISLVGPLLSSKDRQFYLKTFAVGLTPLLPMFVGYLNHGLSPSAATNFQSKVTSFNDRYSDLVSVLQFLFEFPFGVGVGQGMNVINKSISNGFATVLLESGVIGFSFYISFFVILFAKATYVCMRTSGFLRVISLSIIVIIIMGVQRQKADASFFHFWLISSFYSINYFSLNKFIEKRCQTVL